MAKQHWKNRKVKNTDKLRVHYTELQPGKWNKILIDYLICRHKYYKKITITFQFQILTIISCWNPTEATYFKLGENALEKEWKNHKSSNHTTQIKKSTQKSTPSRINPLKKMTEK